MRSIKMLLYFFIHADNTTQVNKTTQLLFLTTPDFKIAQVAGVFVEHMLRPPFNTGPADLDKEIVQGQRFWSGLALSATNIEQVNGVEDGDNRGIQSAQVALR